MKACTKWTIGRNFLWTSKFNHLNQNPAKNATSKENINQAKKMGRNNDSTGRSGGVRQRSSGKVGNVWRAQRPQKGRMFVVGIFHLYTENWGAARFTFRTAYLFSRSNWFDTSCCWSSEWLNRTLTSRMGLVGLGHLHAYIWRRIGYRILYQHYRNRNFVFRIFDIKK